MKTKKARLTKLEEARALREKVAILKRDLRIAEEARDAIARALEAAPALERARVARMAHGQLARWATLAAVTGEHVDAGGAITVPMAELVAWFDALSPEAAERRAALARQREGGNGAGDGRG
jgi:hypothetical protein